VGCHKKGGIYHHSLFFKELQTVEEALKSENAKKWEIAM
jgi:hypothetical protein